MYAGCITHLRHICQVGVTTPRQVRTLKLQKLSSPKTRTELGFRNETNRFDLEAFASSH